MYSIAGFRLSVAGRMYFLRVQDGGEGTEIILGERRAQIMGFGEALSVQAQLPAQAWGSAQAGDGCYQRFPILGFYAETRSRARDQVSRFTFNAANDGTARAHQFKELRGQDFFKYRQSL